MVVVDDEDVIGAYGRLAMSGIWVEPTAAAAWAALERLPDNWPPGPIVVNLGGAGYKKPIASS